MGSINCLRTLRGGAPQNKTRQINTEVEKTLANLNKQTNKGKMKNEKSMLIIKRTLHTTLAKKYEKENEWNGSLL